MVDSCVLIRANEDYYPLDRVPQFWEWIEQEAIAGRVKIPFEIYSEIAVWSGLFRDWICRRHIREALVLGELIDDTLVKRVLADGYGKNLTENEMGKIGRDPFLIAYALAKERRVVVTKETPKPTAQRANRKIPDVCETFRIQCITDFELYRALNFTTAG